MKTESLKTCKCCKTEYSKREVNRIYGKNSAVAYYGYCSAKCYTEAFINNKSHVLYSSDPITKLF